jgi:hypothetical protein
LARVCQHGLVWLRCTQSVTELTIRSSLARPSAPELAGRGGRHFVGVGRQAEGLGWMIPNELIERVESTNPRVPFSDDKFFLCTCVYSTYNLDRWG